MHLHDEEEEDDKYENDGDNEDNQDDYYEGEDEEVGFKANSEARNDEVDDLDERKHEIDTSDHEANIARDLLRRLCISE